MKTKFGVKQLTKKTPSKFKILGNALMVVGTGTFATIVTLQQLDIGLDQFIKDLGKWSAIGGIVGKFITMLFGEHSLNDEASNKG